MPMEEITKKEGSEVAPKAGAEPVVEAGLGTESLSTAATAALRGGGRGQQEFVALVTGNHAEPTPSNKGAEEALAQFHVGPVAEAARGFMRERALVKGLPTGSFPSLSVAA